MGSLFGGGTSAIEKEAQGYRKDFGAAIPGIQNQGMDWMNQGIGGLNSTNNNISNYISGIGKDPMNQSMQSYLSQVMNGSRNAAQGQSFNAQAMQGDASRASATDLGMQGKMFAQQFGSDLGGLALQQRNMQTVADKLGSTTDNPFALLNGKATEDSAAQNNAGMLQLQSQLAAQGLDSTSGSGAAALAALQFNTNKSVADAYRQNAVQGAQFQQQGLGMAGNIYNQLAGLDLQRATTQGQLGLQGYQADNANAQRMDAVAMQNAQLGTQASLANAQMGTQANLQNAQLATQNSMGNAQMQNQWQQAALQGQLGLMGQNQNAALQAYGLQSQNYGTQIGAGSNLFGQGYAGQQNYMNSLNQSAAGQAQGRGTMIGSLLQGGLGLAGTLLGGPVGGMIGSGVGKLFGGLGGPGYATGQAIHGVNQQYGYTPIQPNWN